MTHALRSSLRRLLSPRMLHLYRMARHTTFVPFERELRIVPRFLDSEKFAIDVGANVGLYTAVLARRSRRVFAFEPHPGCADYLRRLKMPRWEVVEAAASDRDGTAVLDVPAHQDAESPALSRCREPGEQAQPPAGTVQYPVRQMRLDDYIARALTPSDVVGFMKVDVEGHELAVMKGAGEIIARHRPTMLVETEFRHDADVEGLFALLAAASYRAFVAAGSNELRPIDASGLQRLQPAENLAQTLARQGHAGYVNNVFFIPRERPPS